MTEKELETIEVVDRVEANYGAGKEAATKKVTREKAQPADSKDKPELEKKEPDPKKKEGSSPIEVADKKEPVKEKEIVTDDGFNDPFEVKDSKKEKEKPKESDKDARVVTEKDLERERKFDDYQKKAEIFDSLANTPIGKILLKAQEMGKNPLEVLKEIAPIDYSKMASPESDDVRAREYFSKIEGESGETLEQSIKEFLSMDEGLMKKRMRKDQISDLSNHQQHKLKDFEKDLNSSSDRGQEILSKLSSDTSDFIKDVKKKKGMMFGMQLTDEQLTEFENDIVNFNVLGEDGFVNVADVAAAVFFKKHGRQRLKENYLKGLSKGKEEVLETVHNVDPNETSLNNKTFEKKEVSKESKIEERYGAGAQKSN